MAYLVLYNPLAGNGMGKKNLDLVSSFAEKNDCEFRDVTTEQDLSRLLEEFPDRDIILVGGDGTLNNFIVRHFLSSFLKEAALPFRKGQLQSVITSYNEWSAK